MTVWECGHLLRSGKASSLELVQESLDRIQRLDKFHTFITITEEQATRTAIERDREMAAGIDRGPFHGVPIAYKDLFFTRGLRTTAGSLIYRDFIPDYDATVVEKLYVGGAVSLGKLNLHELAYGATSKNPHYGAVLNPRDPSRTPGGSSGGSGVAIAAGFVPMAVGTDTGGSIRVPASYCGVVGFKPTYGRVSRYGVFPLAFSLDHVGPLGSSVEDCALAMAEIAGHDHRDSSSTRIEVADFYAGPLNNLRGVKLGVPKNFYFDRISHDVARAIQNSIQTMEKLGALITEIELPDIEQLNATQRTIQWGEASAVYASCDDPKCFSPDAWNLIRQGRNVRAVDYVNAQRLRTLFRRRFDEVWRAIDLLATPTTPVTAPLVEQDEVEIDGHLENVRLASTRLTRAINLLGEPALSLPCGKSGNGMPIGLQLIAPPFQDHWLLRVGRAVECEMRG
jgi:aspartyl-tRNA(Asn)/glutamyl-tRNA(Gln) amidotransferase subunit A